MLQINDLRGLHHYLCPVAATGARSTQHAIHRPRATVQLAGPALGSFSARTRFVVLALIPVAGFLANGVTYVSGEGNVGRAFATVTQSHALVDSSRDFKSAVAVEAEGLEAQVRQFLTNVQAA